MRAAVLVLVGVLVLAAGALAAVLAVAGGSDPPDYRGSSPPARMELPDVALRDHSGRVVDTRALADKVVLVTFLDSQCREACPVIVGHVARALDLLDGEVRRRVVALAITTDPAEDTAASVRSFLRRAGGEGKLRYVVGSERELRPVWRAFKVLPSADTGRDDLHSAPVRIFDRDGVWVSTQHAGADLSAAALAHDLQLAANR
jgi:cytochrome oxidase Cu insertion factor (SCO1/SenC/PrrC family)